MKDGSVAILEQTPGILSSMLVTATGEQMDWQPSPDRWSISMVLAHLADVETHGFMQRFRAMVTEEAPFLPSYDQLALFATGKRFDGREQLELFRERRRSTLQWLAALPESAADRSGQHEELGVIRVGELLHEFAFHDLGHIRQIAELYRSHAHYPHMGGFQKYYKIKP